MAEAKLGLSARHFADGSEQETALPGWTQRYAQTGSGRYAGEVRQLRLDGITVTRERINVGIEQRTAPPAGRRVFVQTLSQGADWRMNAETITAESSCFIAGGEEFHAAMPKGFDLVFVEYGEDRGLVHPPADGSITRVPGGAEPAAVAAWLLSLVMTFPALSEAGAQEMIAVLPGMIIDRLSYLDGLVRRRAERRSATQTDWTIFRLVRDIVDAAGQDPLTVADVSQRIGLPETVVRQAFVNTVGTGPATWMRCQRLNGARRDLLAAEGERSVSEIAARWGFWHFGRFSKYYADLFGEVPSQTRARA